MMSGIRVRMNLSCGFRVFALTDNKNINLIDTRTAMKIDNKFNYEMPFK